MITIKHYLDNNFEYTAAFDQTGKLVGLTGKSLKGRKK